MAHFYGGVHGNRGEATRLGTKDSGLNTFANGWGIGARTVCYYLPDKDEDRVQVWITHGSGYGSPSLFLGTFHIKDGKIEKIEQE